MVSKTEVEDSRKKYLGHETVLSVRTEDSEVHIICINKSSVKKYIGFL